MINPPNVKKQSSKNASLEANKFISYITKLIHHR